MSEEIEFSLTDVKIQNSEGRIINLGDVKNLVDLKRKIIDEIEFPFCRNCGFQPLCQFYKKSRGDNCQLLEGVFNRYVDMNIKSINYLNKYELIEFIRSCYYFMHMSKDFLDLLGIYIDDHWNWYFESDHPSMNSLFSHKILIKLSKYIDSIRKVNLRRLKKFAILVEGESDSIILKTVLEKLKVLGLSFDIKNSVKIFILDSKSRAKKDKIKSHLKRFRELDSEYFLFLDEDAKDITDELIKEGLISADNVFFFKPELEDEYPLPDLIDKIKKLNPDIKSAFKIKQVKEMLKKKNLKNALAKIANENGKYFNLDSIKIELAKMFAKDIAEDLDQSVTDDTGCHRGDWTPKSKKFSKLVERIRPLATKINKLSSDFFVIKNDKKSFPSSKIESSGTDEQ